MPLTHATGQRPQHFFKQPFRNRLIHPQIGANRARRRRTIMNNNTEFITEQPASSSKSSAKIWSIAQTALEGKLHGHQAMGSKDTVTFSSKEDNHESRTSPVKKSLSSAYAWIGRWSKSLAPNHGTCP